jgi:hypothetical protein
MAELPGRTADKSIRPYLGSPGWLRLVAGTVPPPTAEGQDGQYALMTDLVRYRLHAAGLDGGMEALQALLPSPGRGISRSVPAGDAAEAIAASTGRTWEAERIVDALRLAGLVSVRRPGDLAGVVEFSDDAIAV